MRKLLFTTPAMVAEFEADLARCVPAKE